MAADRRVSSLLSAEDASRLFGEADARATRAARAPSFAQPRRGRRSGGPSRSASTASYAAAEGSSSARAGRRKRAERAARLLGEDVASAELPARRGGGAAGGGGGEARVAELEAEAAELRAAGEKKAAYIHGVRRNYQALARLCREKLAEKAALQEALRALGERAAGLQAGGARAQALQERVAALEAEAAGLRQLNGEGDKMLEELRGEAAQQRRRAAELAEAREDLVAHLKRVRASSDARRARIEELEDAAEADDTRQRLEELQAAHAALRAERDGQRERADGLEARLGEAAHEARCQANVLERAERDARLAAGDLERERERSRAAGDEATRARAGEAAAEGRARDLALEVEQLRSEVRIHRKGAPDLQDRLRFAERQAATLQEQFDCLAAAKDEADRLRAAAEREAAGERAVADAAREELAAARGQARALEARLAEAAEHLAARESAAESATKRLRGEAADLRSRLDGAEDENVRLRDALERYGLAVEDAERVEAQGRELRATIAKLIASEEAAEAAFTCVVCLQTFDDTVVTGTCGHSFCGGCVADGACVHCHRGGNDADADDDDDDDEAEPVVFHRNEMLASLASKSAFRKQALASLRNLAAPAAPAARAHH